MKLSFRHLGIACDDIATCKGFIKSTMKVVNESKTIFDENQNASLCTLTLASGVQLELITGPVVANLVKKGMTYYHTCYGVPDIEKAISFLRKKHKAVVISEIKPSKLFNNRRVAFLYAPIGVLELLEDKK